MRFKIEEKRIRKYELRVIEIDDAESVSHSMVMGMAAAQLGNYDRGRVATPADIAAVLSESRSWRLQVLDLLGIKEPESE